MPAVRSDRWDLFMYRKKQEGGKEMRSILVLWVFRYEEGLKTRSDECDGDG